MKDSKSNGIIYKILDQNESSFDIGLETQDQL